ncbi:phage tail tip fiber protein [Pseudomonas sp. Z13]|uniref:phage tail tip fiber protein n=1 Tax=Pseudomonas sp. Z13 TaxID=2983409 RepID=UPI002E7FC36E|nr:DUF1983 domain-containing protein [Pseudomonas sp. Z13]
MTDPQIHSLVAQVQANAAQIQVESSARAAADEVLAKRIGSLEAVLTGDIQSASYVPGVSGWKLNTLTGEFEINSCTTGSASNAPERQMVSVEVASWSKHDLPKNAANLLQFMQAELQKVPEQYRHAAEFEEFDASYSDESFNTRLFLSYSRLETEEELADRLAKAKYAGMRIVRAGGCTTGIHDGVVRWKFGNLGAPLPEPEQPKPFKEEGSKVFLSEAMIQDGIVKSPWPAAWGVRMQLGENGKLYAAGIDLGLPSQIVVSADRFAINGRSASDILEMLAGKVGKTELGQDLKGQIDPLGSNLAEQVKAVIRKELMPGGLLHRSR